MYAVFYVFLLIRISVCFHMHSCCAVINEADVSQNIVSFVGLFCKRDIINVCDASCRSTLMHD